MAREPRQKGTSVLPVVAALKAHPDRQKLVPESLWKYFEDPGLVSGWYPEGVYFALLEALVKTLDPAALGGDVWRYFARFSVQRDIVGVDATGTVPSGYRGIYGSFAEVDASDPAQFFRQTSRLWSQYHDTGAVQIRGGRVATNTVVLGLLGFHIPIEGFVHLQGYYVEELGRLVGLQIVSKVTESTARGKPTCEWEYALARTPATEAYVASLALLA